MIFANSTSPYVVYQALGEGTSTTPVNIEVVNDWAYGATGNTTTGTVAVLRKTVSNHGLTVTATSTKIKWCKWPGGTWADVEDGTVSTQQSGWASFSTASCGTYFSDAWWDAVPPPKPLEDRLSEIIRQRMAPQIIITRPSLPPHPDLREIRARETLRRVLGEAKFKLYLKKGFVTVVAKSGLVYQISEGHHITNVWDCGVLVERLCIYLQGGFPPTDSVIMQYLLILNNEEQFRSLGIKHGVTQPLAPMPKVVSPTPSLVEMFENLKKHHPRRRRKAA